MEAKPIPIKKDQRRVEYFENHAPDFVTLQVGQYVEGVFLGMMSTQYGPCYRFVDPKTGETFAVSGNRVQLDRVFEDVSADRKHFPPAGASGHYLIVERMQDVQSSQGREVGVYRIGHCLTDCDCGKKAQQQQTTSPQPARGNSRPSTQQSRAAVNAGRPYEDLRPVEE